MHARWLAITKHRSLALVALFLIVAAATGARCHKPDTRVVIFIQGIYTTYDSEGTQGTSLEAHRFDTLKNALAGNGYTPGDLLDYSYNGGGITGEGDWRPAPYDCEDTDRAPEDNLAPLEQMMRDYRSRHPDAHFALVGHSLGGYIAFLAGARDAARADNEKLGVDVVVTLDAPLAGVAADKKIILDFVPCEKTYLAGADLVAARLDAGTPGVRSAQAASMADAGIRLATLGNVNDCLFATARCLGGGEWADDSGTQFLDGAAFSRAYTIESALLDSHDAILADSAAIADAATFIGAP